MPIRNYIRPIAFWLMLLAVSVAFYELIKPFLLTVFWAVLLSIIFQTPYRRLRIRFRGRDNTAALLTTLLIILCVVIPGFFLVLALINESIGVYERIQSGEWNLANLVDVIQQQMPRLEQLLRQVGLTPERMKADLGNFAVTAARNVADRLLSYTQNAITFTAQFFMMVYVLFFFLRDGRSILQSVMNALPFGNRWERILLERFAGVARATLKGTLTVAVLQGAIGGIIFVILGIEGALFWGVVMILLSLLPVGGSSLVWGPAAVILAWQGLWIKAIILVVVGALGIGLIDNILRPVLVGRDTKMPDYLVLLSTLGGLAWFGLSGFVLGPVIAALFLTFWSAAGKDYGGTEA